MLHEVAQQEAKRDQKLVRFPNPDQAPLPIEPPEAEGEGDVAALDRTRVENELIRALLEYATEGVQIQLKQEGDGSPETLEVPFAELVIHRLEEEDIAIKNPLNQEIVRRFTKELDEERILTADQLAHDVDMDVQQKVAGALVKQHQLSPNWSHRHKIYPTVERDQLVMLLEDGLRRLHLIDLRAQVAEVSERLVVGGLSEVAERDLLTQKVQLDREIQHTIAHFGTVILP